MVRIRLTRRGKRNRPFYRVVAIDARSSRDGRSLEILGYYDPKSPDESRQFSVKRERVSYWLDKGAQPSETVRSILKRSGYNFHTKQWTLPAAASAATAGQEKAPEADS